MGTIITFLATLLAVVLFLFFKVWEAKRRKKIAPHFRARADSLVSNAGTRIRNKIDDFYKNMSFKKAAEASVGHTARIIAATAQKIETGATHLAEKVLEPGGVRRETTSNFLKEVSNHKKSLDTERVRRETSLTNDTPE